ncbi:hypothetical protein GEMRC1_009908 [Eukaryota sp. GEM-RC1]
MKGETMDDQIEEQSSSDDDFQSTSVEDTVSEKEMDDVSDPHVTEDTKTESSSVSRFIKVFSWLDLCRGKTLLASAERSSGHLLHWQSITQSLASHTVNHSADDVSHVYNYEYDLDSEDSISQDRVLYNRQTHWYSNHLDDSALSSSEKLNVARGTIASSRYFDVLNSLLDNVLKAEDLIEQNSLIRTSHLMTSQQRIHVVWLALSVGSIGICGVLWFKIRQWIISRSSSRVLQVMLVIVLLISLLIGVGTMLKIRVSEKQRCCTIQ